MDAAMDYVPRVAAYLLGVEFGTLIVALYVLAITLYLAAPHASAPDPERDPDPLEPCR